MTDLNPTPATELSTPPDIKTAPPFYVVAPRKFTILFIATLGGYQLYWFYKNWRCFKDRTPVASASDASIWPVPRALFSVFFIHSLFREVKQHAPDKPAVAAWRQSGHATALVILILASNVLSRLASHFNENFWLNAVSLMTLIPMLFTMRGAQDMINLACDDPEGTANANLTAANYAWIVLGCIFWLIILLAMFATGPQQSAEAVL